MSESFALLMAQINVTVGAIGENTRAVIDVIEKHQKRHDLIVFPELVLTGYPPEDLLLRPECMIRVEKALQDICAVTQETYAVIGHPLEDSGALFNALSIIHQGQIQVIYKKQHLPNAGVFDEKRYFEPGPEIACILTIKDHTIGFCICEDIWKKGPIEQVVAANADILVCINASPFEIDKFEQRQALLKAHIPHQLCFVYVNLVGGQDELVFDGRSFVLDHQAKIQAEAPAFVEHLQTVHIQKQTIQSSIAKPLEEHALIYQALCTGLAEYINKNHFPGVLFGLSGGIDSALTLAIAVDALGPERVHTLALPSRYTSNTSTEDIEKLIQMQPGVTHHTLLIEPGFEALLDTLTPHLENQTVPEITQQNLQARLRGMILMAFSNSNHKLVLSTSNKSESAVGYTTLYGDMCGGFAPIKDVPKTLVYALAKYRNAQSPVIPERVITRAPSAELAPNQTDQDTLPAYPELDAIIAYYMNEKLSTEDIIAKGHKSSVVEQVIRLIKRNEYKRRQAAVGTKISKRAFGRDWRYPIVSKF